MTYLVTGATGFIGKRLVETLLAGGHSVHYLGRKRSAAMDLRAAFHPWPEPQRTLAPLDSVPRCDAIVNLAGESLAQRWTAEVKKEIENSRTLVTRNLVEALSRVHHKPGVLVSASGVGYYGDRGDEVLTEQSPPGSGGFLAHVCAEWEREAERAGEAGLRVVRIRIGVVLSAEGGALHKMLPPFRLGVGGRLGDGRQWMSWIHRDDLIGMIRWAAENDAVSGALNGTAPEPVTNQQFTRVLARALHRPAMLPVPRFALRVMLGEMSDVLFESARAIPAIAQSRGFPFNYDRLVDAIGRELSSPATVASL
ncbi:MAG: TIGR01777 family oxidoreductase [Bryobacteraceae bacterium]